MELMGFMVQKVEKVQNVHVVHEVYSSENPNNANWCPLTRPDLGHDPSWTHRVPVEGKTF